MPRHLFFISLLFITSCIDLNKPTEFQAMIKPVVGEDVTFETNEDTPLYFEYSVEPDEKSVSLSILVDKHPSHGRLEECTQTNTTVFCKYIPNKDFYGIDELFTVTTKDGDFKGNKSSKVSIQVNSVFDAPQGRTQGALTLISGTAKDFVLNPAHTIEKEELLYEVVQAPQHGTLSNCMSSLSCRYTTNNSGYLGQDSFTFRAKGKISGLTSAPMEVAINITNFLVPDGENMNFSLAEDTVKEFNYTVQPLATSQNLKVSVKTQPLHGQLEGCVNLPLNSIKCLYRPNANYFGNDEVVFQVSDGQYNSPNNPKLIINVSSVYDAPSLPSQAALSLNSGETKNFNLTPGTTIEDEQLEYIIVTEPSSGNITNCLKAPHNKSLNCSYTPNAGFVGNDNLVIKARGVTSGMYSNPQSINISVESSGRIINLNAETQTLKPKVSILLVIDNSASMAPYQSLLAPRVGAMIQNLSGTNTDLYVVSSTFLGVPQSHAANQGSMSITHLLHQKTINSNGNTVGTIDIGLQHPAISKYQINPTMSGLELSEISSNIQGQISTMGVSGSSIEVPALNTQLIIEQSNLLNESQYAAVMILSNENNSFPNAYYYGTASNFYLTAHSSLLSNYTITTYEGNSQKETCPSAGGPGCTNPKLLIGKNTVRLVFTNPGNQENPHTTYYANCQEPYGSGICQSMASCSQAQKNAANQGGNNNTCVSNVLTNNQYYYLNEGAVCPEVGSLYNQIFYVTSCSQVGTWRWGAPSQNYSVSGNSITIKNTAEQYKSMLDSKFGAGNYFFSAITHLNSSESCFTNSGNASVGNFYKDVANLIPEERKKLISVCNNDYSDAVEPIKNFVITQTSRTFTISLTSGEMIQNVARVRNQQVTVLQPSQYTFNAQTGTLVIAEGILEGLDIVRVTTSYVQ